MRVKGGYTTRRRRKAVLKQAEGYWGNRHISFRNANQSLIRASQYAYRDRKNKKREFRRLWIARLNVTVRALGYTYSQFIHALVLQNISLNRKVLSEWAIKDNEAFTTFVKGVMDKYQPNQQK